MSWLKRLFSWLFGSEDELRLLRELSGRLDKLDKLLCKVLSDDTTEQSEDLKGYLVVRGGGRLPDGDVFLYDDEQNHSILDTGEVQYKITGKVVCRGDDSQVFRTAAASLYFESERLGYGVCKKSVVTEREQKFYLEKMRSTPSYSEDVLKAVTTALQLGDYRVEKVVPSSGKRGWILKLDGGNLLWLLFDDGDEKPEESTRSAEQEAGGELTEALRLKVGNEVAALTNQLGYESRVEILQETEPHLHIICESIREACVSELDLATVLCTYLPSAKGCNLVKNDRSLVCGAKTWTILRPAEVSQQIYVSIRKRGVIELTQCLWASYYERIMRECECWGFRFVRVSVHGAERRFRLTYPQEYLTSEDVTRFLDNVASKVEGCESSTEELIAAHEPVTYACRVSLSLGQTAVIEFLRDDPPKAVPSDNDSLRIVDQVLTDKCRAYTFGLHQVSADKGHTSYAIRVKTTNPLFGWVSFIRQVVATSGVKHSRIESLEGSQGSSVQRFKLTLQDSRYVEFSFICPPEDV